MPLKLKKRGPYWYAIGTVAGQRVRKSLETGDRQTADEIRAALEARLLKEAIYGREAVAIFEEAAISYMESGGETRFIAPLLRHFGGRRIASIKPGEIRDAGPALYPGRAPSTWNRQVLRPARAVINHAAARGLCPPIKVEAFKEKKPERTAVDEGWIDAFCDEADRRGLPHLAALARFMFETGTRVGEALQLEPLDLDLDARQARSRSETTKNGDPRIIDLTDRTTQTLRGLPPRRGLVFGYASRWSIRSSWMRVCRDAGLEYVPPHQAGRHSFATTMDAAGLTTAEIADAGGWKSRALVLDRYTHPRNAGRKAAEVFNARASGRPDIRRVK